MENHIDLTEQEEQIIAKAVKFAFTGFIAEPPFSKEAIANFTDLLIVTITGKNHGYKP